MQFDTGKRVEMIADILNMRFGRTAPMVAHAIKTHDMLHPWCHCLCSSQNLFREIGSKGDVRGHKPHAHDFPATRAAPAKHIGRQVYPECCGTVEDIPHAARRFQDIGERCLVTECIDLITNSRTNAQTLQKVTPPMAELSLTS